MRTHLLSLLACASMLLAAGTAAQPARAPASEPVGQVTLRWTLTVEGSDAYSKECHDNSAAGYANTTNEWNDHLTLTYEGKWTWKVLRDDADVEHLEMDLGQGEHGVSGSGGGSERYEFQRGPKADLCPAGRGLRDSYWVPVSSSASSSWSYQVREGDDGHAYATLTRQGDEMYYRVDWDWDQEITIDGTMASSSQGCQSSSDSEKCGTETPYPICSNGNTVGGTIGVLLGQAMQTWREQEKLEGKVRPKEWGFSVSGSATYHPEPVVEGDDYEGCREGRTLQGSATLQYILTYEREPCDLEAVITMPSEEGYYENWQPWAGRDEKTVGNQFHIEVELRYKDRPGETPQEKATFQFRLIDTSREPGVCLNAPSKDQVDQKRPFDLKIDQDSNPDLEIDDIEGGQAATTRKAARGAGVTISSYDWGAYGRLQVTATIEGQDRTLVAHLDGHPEKEMLTIPLDDNDNHVADSWEKSEGVLGRNLPADWDGAWEPPGQKSEGDGISLYERYRGFESGPGGNMHHGRLHVSQKYIFIYDPDGIVLKAMMDPRSMDSGLAAVSQCGVRIVDDKHWTGAGAAQDGKRLVNFNHGYGHAVDQHALDIRQDENTGPVHPPEWEKHYETTTGSKYPEGVEDARGITYPEYGTGRNLQSPRDAFRIVIFADNIWQALYYGVASHTRALPEFKSAGNEDVEREVARYITEHMDQASEAYMKQLARVVSHEAGHGLGLEHHDPTDAGDKTCVMRYQSAEDCPPNADDRFELACYDPWPNKYCTGGANCWGHVQVSDR